MIKLEKYGLYALAGGAVLLALYIAARGAKGAASDIVGGVLGGAIGAVTGAVQGAYEALPEPIKPSSQNNVIYRGAGVLVRQLPGSNDSSTLGTWLYDITH